MHKSVDGEIDTTAHEKGCNHRPIIPVMVFVANFKYAVKYDKYTANNRAKGYQQFGKILFVMTGV
jgi:hypothetical protein